MALKIGLVGTDGVAWEALAAFVHSQRVSTVALAEADAERTRRVRDRYGIIRSATSDYAELLADGGLDLVAVCLPPAQQPEVVLAALAAGRDVLVSGPPAASAAEAEAMVAAAAAAGRRLWCMLYQRFIPAHLRTPALLQEAALGDLSFAAVSVAVPETSGPGAVAAETYHALDLLQHLVGPIEAVSCLRREQPETVLVSLQFAGGALGEVAVLTSAPEARPVAERRLVGPSGMVLIRDNPEDELPLLVFEADAVFPVKLKAPPNVREYAVIAAVEHLLACVAQGNEPEVTMAEAVAALRVADAAGEAARTGCRVTVVGG